MPGRAATAIELPAEPLQPAAKKMTRPRDGWQVDTRDRVLTRALVVFVVCVRRFFVLLVFVLLFVVVLVIFVAFVRFRW